MRLKADITLFMVALIWGSAFVAQRVAAQHMGFFYFNALRFLLGGILLLPLAFRLRPASPNFQTTRKSLIRLTIIAGVVLFCASAFQQAGIRYTTAGNAGFITGLYVVVVPFLLWVFLRQQVSGRIWTAALLAVMGVMLLSTGGELHFAPGDILELFGAFLWALHVILIDRAVQRIPIFVFAAGQYLTAAVLNLGFGIVLEYESWTIQPSAAWTILYTGVFSIALGYTLQAIAQRHAPPSDAALILSMEAVFAAIAGYWFLGEILDPIQILGCGFVLGAIFLSQWVEIRKGILVGRFPAQKRLD